MDPKITPPTTELLNLWKERAETEDPGRAVGAVASLLTEVMCITSALAMVVKTTKENPIEVRTEEEFKPLRLDIEERRQINKNWLEACEIARQYCPVEVGESHIRDGIPRLAKKLEALESLVASLGVQFEGSTVPQEIARLREVEKRWKEDCAFAAEQCSVELGENSIREGISKLSQAVPKAFEKGTEVGYREALATAHRDL